MTFLFQRAVFFQVAGLRSFLGCINQNSRHSSGQQRQHHIAGIAVRRGMEWCPTTLIQFILTKKAPQATLAGGFHPSEKYAQSKLHHLPGQESKMFETIT